jgi:uncharacterized protein (TIGR02453 family)
MTASSFAGFPKDTLHFLEDLQANNDRAWFAEHKSRYEQSVLAPALELISALQKPLAKVAPLLRVEPKRMGGSLMRIYKDTRFSKDKLPYKTNIGIQFRHQFGGDVHAPGVYLHIAPAECFLGVGTWRPPSDALRKIRDYIVAHETSWKKLLKQKRFNDTFSMYADRLKSTPRGYDKQHPLIDELRQQSFIGMAQLSRKQIEGKELVGLIPQLITAGNPLMVAICQALEQPW